MVPALLLFLMNERFSDPVKREEQHPEIKIQYGKKRFPVQLRVAVMNGHPFTGELQVKELHPDLIIEDEADGAVTDFFNQYKPAQVMFPDINGSFEEGFAEGGVEDRLQLIHRNLPIPVTGEGESRETKEHQQKQQAT